MKWHTETRKISELKNWESNPNCTVILDRWEKLTGKQAVKLED